MRFHKKNWLDAVVEKLLRDGFRPNGLAAIRLESSFQRKRVIVEIRGGRTLRVLKGGTEYIHPNCSLAKAIEIVNAAAIAADFSE